MFMTGGINSSGNIKENVCATHETLCRPTMGQKLMESMSKRLTYPSYQKAAYLVHHVRLDG